jgi:diketogulonate reductase-like aldo/keto reductase
MKYETLYDGQKLPVIGLGTWTFGGGMSANHSMNEKHVDTINKAIKMGYSHIDTAEMYGQGHTEELVGRAIKDFSREKLFITTKVWSTNLRYKDVLNAFRRSLERLDIDYVDLYLIHWPNSSIPLEESFRAFNELAHSGQTRYVGVSNFDTDQLKQAQRFSDSPIATNQVEYNVLTRDPERDGVLDYCLDQNILLTAYEPLGKGRLIHHSGIQQIALKYKISVAQVALYWLIQKQKVITIPMSSNLEHLRENLKAVEITLAGEDVKTLNNLGF